MKTSHIIKSWLDTKCLMREIIYTLKMESAYDMSRHGPEIIFYEYE